MCLCGSIVLWIARLNQFSCFIFNNIKKFFMKKSFVFLYLLLSSFFLHAQIFKNDAPLANTYSIVARDPVTGEMGVAVQSHWFSVGTAVSWVEAGIGAVATQRNGSGIHLQSGRGRDQ
jgi:hypothetical protein